MQFVTEPNSDKPDRPIGPEFRYPIVSGPRISVELFMSVVLGINFIIYFILQMLNIYVLIIYGKKLDSWGRIDRF